jgi:hypothetical protein
MIFDAARLHRFSWSRGFMPLMLLAVGFRYATVVYRRIEPKFHSAN